MTKKFLCTTHQFNELSLVQTKETQNSIGKKGNGGLHNTRKTKMPESSGQYSRSLFLPGGTTNICTIHTSNLGPLCLRRIGLSFFVSVFYHHNHSCSDGFVSTGIESIDPSQYGGVITSDGYKTYKKKKRQFSRKRFSFQNIFVSLS